MSFSGFPPETLAFLSGLSANNDRDWFQAHRKDYESYWVAPAKGMVAAMAPHFAEFAPQVHCEPRINGSIFRLNRDTRFSKDKTPYKTQVDLWFWEGEDRGRENAGFFFRLTPQGVLLGAGMHGLQKVPLKRYRDAVDTGGAVLQGILDDIEAAGFGVMGEAGKRVPRGYDPDHPHAGLLKKKALFCEWTSDGVEDVVHSPEFPAFVADKYRQLVPLVRWFNDTALK